jgi:ABC-2 type transport system permease protein
MSLIAAERIKLASTRSPWWCAGLAVVSTVTLSMVAAFATARDSLAPVTVATTQMGYTLGMAVVMVMAALAVTTEYSVGTIRTTFIAMPHRGHALAAKTVVVAILGFLIGLAISLSSWAIGLLVLPDANLTLTGATEWRQVGGVALVYAVAAVTAVAVGTLTRHTAGAVAIVLVWTLMAEQLLVVIPGVGEAARPFLPFQAAKQFLSAGEVPADAGLLDRPWFALGYFAVTAAALLAIAIGVARRRDA